jgi:hypothetical protein
MGTATRLLLMGVMTMACSGARAQQPLYSNSGGGLTDPGIATGAVSESGQIAPTGWVWSEAPIDGTGAAVAVAGFSCHDSVTGGCYRFADDFTFGGIDAWHLTGVSVYFYQPGTGAPQLSSANVRVWNGRPGDPGSGVIFGDVTTNRVTAVVPTGIYRVFNSVAAPLPPAPDTSRPVWKVDLDLSGLVLSPGTYWLDWQLSAVAAGTECFSPPVTVAGARGKPGANAVQLRPSAVWTAVMDAGKPSSAADAPQDLPFIVTGFSGSAGCVSDIDGNGFVNGDDYDQFRIWFEDADSRSDVDGNGFVNGDDFDLFMIAFTAGC